MKKKIWSFAVLFCLCLFLFPLDVKAAGGTSFSDAKEVKAGKTYKYSTKEDKTIYLVYRVPETGYFTYSLTSKLNFLDENEVTVYNSSLEKIDGMRASADGIQRSYYYSFKKGQKVYFCLKMDAYYDTGMSASIKISQKKANNWEQEINNTRKTANTLKSGKNVYGVSLKAVQTDVDWYKYKVENTGYFTFDFQTMGEGYNDYKLEFFAGNSDNAFLQYSGIENACKTQKINFKKGTTVYIRIENDDWHNVNTRYRIKVKFSKSSRYEQEGNDTMPKACKISLKTPFKGNLMNNYDVDYYKVKATKNGTLKLALTSDVDIESRQGWKVTIYDSSKKKITNADDVIFNKTLKWKAKKGKTYYVKVEASSTYSCRVSGEDYSLKATY